MGEAIDIGVVNLCQGAATIEEGGQEVILGGEAEVLEGDGILDDVEGAAFIELLDDDEVRAQGGDYDALGEGGRRGDGGHLRGKFRVSSFEGRLEETTLEIRGRRRWWRRTC
jgi:hypothetical protein